MWITHAVDSIARRIVDDRETACTLASASPHRRLAVITGDVVPGGMV